MHKTSAWPLALVYAALIVFASLFPFMGWRAQGIPPWVFLVAPGSAAERDRLLLMARKLMRFTTLLMVPAVGLGLWLWLGYGIGWGPGNGWMHAKLAIVVLVLAYHHACGVQLRQFVAGTNHRSHRWFRWFNEAPVLMLLAVVVLVVVKPF